MKVLVLPGSTRRQSLNRKLARCAADSLARAGAEVDLAELAEFEVPLYDGDLEAERGAPPGALALHGRIQAAGALCVVTPEYNHSVPGTVKNLVDWLSRVKPRATKGVPALLMSASPGPAGGSRGAAALEVALEAIGMLAYPTIFSLPRAQQAFDEDGRLLDRGLAERLDGLAREFVAFARAVAPLAPGRPPDGGG